MKGITPVVATILLLLVTISMVGFAFIWFNRVMGSATESIANQTDTETSKMQMKVKIDNINKASDIVYIRNDGSRSIETSRIIVYVDGTTLATCTWSSTTVVPNEVVSCTVTTPDISSCSTIKATSPGTGDTLSC
ncbi:MAG: archaellin/type IV pilin N-terminal domain-containing protein [Candidatus Aenigmatarchaeota archaeon]